MDTNCLHCDRRPAAPGNDLGLCPACLARPAVTYLYLPRPHWSGAFLAKLGRLAGRRKAGLPLFPEGDRLSPFLG